MTLKQKIFFIPWVVVMMFDIGIIVVFISYFLDTNQPNLYYFLLVCLIAFILTRLRLFFFGQKTVLHKYYFAASKDDWLFIGFISSAMAILITTYLVKYWELSIFQSLFLTDLKTSPIIMLDILNNNYHLLSFYLIIFIFINLPLVFIYEAVKNRYGSSYDQSLKTFLIILAMLLIFIFLYFFISEPAASFWKGVVNLSLVKNFLAYIFSGSLLYFNLYFLLKRA